MSERRDVEGYLAEPETVCRRELVWGVVREPPAPFWSHQAIVMRAAALLYEHVVPRHLGQVVPAPVDVVLDEARALVLQPDVVCLSNARLHLVRDQVWGAPDLVVEVESARTRQRDRVWKRSWYQRYGVGEYWLIDPAAEAITIFGPGPQDEAPDRTESRRRFVRQARVRSTVLPDFDVPASAFF